MRLLVAIAAGLLTAAASCTASPKGAVDMSTPGTPAQDDRQALALRPLPIAGAPAVDGLKLVEAAGEILLLYSTQAETPGGRYELVIHAAPVTGSTQAVEVARIDRMLPPSPRWDARPARGGYEFVYEVAGGAINAIVLRDAAGATHRVSAEHPLESFTRPHFVRHGTDGRTSDVGAIADLKKVVMFPNGAAASVPYTTLADGADGVVGGTLDRWVAAKSLMSGATLFDTLPGRLTLSRVAPGPGTTVPDLLVYELDAAPLADDIVIFATSKPALLLRGRRLARPYQLTAEDRGWLLWLSQPTILVTRDAVHVAAIARPGGDPAFVLYGAVPVPSLGND